MSNLLDKLVRVERTINVYSRRSNELVKEINIDHLLLSAIKDIIAPREEDSELVLGYVLDKKQLQHLLREAHIDLKTDFRIHFYVLEATGIYDW